ncbi:class I SAM-dependent methyltransferase [Pedobacter sp. L105]|uniref:class I SAM-dependent methyltransferase n=1 Tax=Pedobacter sp. L105 TaxID=1641871 RepID=UPI00131C7081|nr:class I SAM-dependent methyltransferase [Pedobacter sp. L105]
MNKTPFPLIDEIFRDTDKGHIKRTRNIRLIPSFENRRGGKMSYAEWAHVIGIFQTIIYQALENKTGNKILDIGCGTGLLGISSEPFVGEGGTYTGIDVMQEDINFCKSHFKMSNYDFIHLDVANATYANDQSSLLKPWPIANESRDLVVALSVWTHMNEVDATFYLKEIHRVLKKGGKAIVTFFFLNDDYEESLVKRSDAHGRFHSTPQNEWIFDVNAYDSKNWMTTKQAKVPEDVIGVTPEGMEILIKNSGLKLNQYYPGNWKEEPGIFFQDILIFEK